MRRSLFPLILLAILIGAMAVLNKGMSKNVSKEHDEDEEQQQQQKEAPKPRAPGQASAVEDPLPAELTLGNPTTAKNHLTLGWQYDEALLTHSTMLPQIFQQLKLWQQSHPDSSLEIVNLDAPKSELSPYASTVTGLGLALNGNSTFVVNGKPTDLGENLGHGSMNPQTLLMALGTVGAK